jgi:hypothetical protein
MSEPVRDEQWVADTFGDVAAAPSNDVEVDEDAAESPNLERPCVGEVADD